ncbi:MAG TPA: glycosyltransferase family 39 protein [Anaerolineales bacterium]|nr:glycosyltransferase family 39 protein [Anaerolineales bacterium]
MNAAEVDPGTPETAGRPTAVTIVLAVALVIAAQTVHGAQPDQVPGLTNAAAGAGILLFLAGLLSTRRSALIARFMNLLDRLGAFLNVSRTRVILVLFGLLFGLLAASASGQGPYQESAALAVALWIGSMVLTAAGAWRSEGARLPSGRTLLIAAGLSGIAFIVRIISVSTIPYVLSGDEASMGQSAIGFIDGTANNIFTIGWFSFPSLFYFVESLSIRLFGNTVLALRIPSAVVGALTVGIVYLLGRALFGRLVGLLAAVYLAGSHFHVHFSRMGLNNIWDGLSFAAVLGALWYGWSRGARAYFILAGLGLGLAQYFYVSSRTMLILIPAWALAAAVIERGKLKRHLADLIVTGLIALVVAAPLTRYFIQNPHEYLAPLNRVRLTAEWVSARAAENEMAKWRVVTDRVWTGLKAYTHTPVRVFYQPDTPLLRPASAAFFLLGLALLLVRSRDLRSWMIVLLLLAFGVSAGLSTNTPAAQRYVAAAPFMALALGYGAAETARAFRSLLPDRDRAFTALAVLGIAYLGADDLRFYFRDYGPRIDHYSGNDLVAQRLADYLQTRPDIAEVYFFGAPRMSYYSIRSIHFLVPEVAGVDINEPWGSAGNPPITSPNPVFVFLPENEADLHAVLAAYPGGILLDERTGDGLLVYWLYEAETPHAASLLQRRSAINPPRSCTAEIYPLRLCAFASGAGSV